MEYSILKKCPEYFVTMGRKVFFTYLLFLHVFIVLNGQSTVCIFRSYKMEVLTVADVARAKTSVHW